MQHDQRATVLSLHRCKLCGNRLRDWDNTCLVRSTKVCTTWFRREPELPCLRIFALGFWELEDELAGLCVMTIRKNSWVTSFENSAFSYFGLCFTIFPEFFGAFDRPWWAKYLLFLFEKGRWVLLYCRYAQPCVLLYCRYAQPCWILFPTLQNQIANNGREE